MTVPNYCFVLIRGLARGNAHWLDFPERLRNQFPQSEVLCLEIPGNGSRFLEQTPLDPVTVIEDFRKSLFAFKESRSKNSADTATVLLGISLGGMIVLKWAELFPLDIDRAFVVNSSLSQFSSPFQRLRPLNYGRLIRSLWTPDFGLREKLILEMTSHFHGTNKTTHSKFLEIAKSNSTSLFNFFRQLILAGRIRIHAKSGANITFLTSEKDELVSYLCTITMAEFCGAKYYVNHSAGHDLVLDDPLWVLDKMSDHLKLT